MFFAGAGLGGASSFASMLSSWSSTETVSAGVIMGALTLAAVVVVVVVVAVGAAMEGAPATPGGARPPGRGTGEVYGILRGCPLLEKN